jgi:hypothetical protein
MARHHHRGVEPAQLDVVRPDCTGGLKSGEFY